MPKCAAVGTCDNPAVPCATSVETAILTSGIVTPPDGEMSTLKPEEDMTQANATYRPRPFVAVPQAITCAR